MLQGEESKKEEENQVITLKRKKLGFVSIDFT